VVKSKVAVMCCSKCDFWYKLSGSVEGKCRCKQSENWNKITLYSATCSSVQPIVIPTFLGDVVKCRV
jgi:hypothetical protein